MLLEAARCWYALDGARQKASRNERFTFGNQWGDAIYDPARQKLITEHKHLLDQGVVPLQNNRIRGIVRSVLGVFSSSRAEPLVTSESPGQREGDVMTVTLHHSYQLNRLFELDRRVLEYFLVSGMSIERISFGYRNGKRDAWVDPVSYHRFFFSSDMEDPRHDDVRLVGMIHDLDIHDVMSQFSGGSRSRALEIRDMYGRSVGTRGYFLVYRHAGR